MTFKCTKLAGHMSQRKSNYNIVTDWHVSDVSGEG